MDREVEIDGFAAALPDEWCVVDGDTIYLPNYQEHNGSTAKHRAQAAHRQRRKRAANSVTPPSRTDRDTTVTREEKKREEENTRTPPTPQKAKFDPAKVKIPRALDTPAFRKSWKAWIEHRKEIGKKLTNTSVDRQLAMLEKLGEVVAIETIEHTIEKGWVGLRQKDAKEPNGKPRFDGSLFDPAATCDIGGTAQS